MNKLPRFSPALFCFLTATAVGVLCAFPAHLRAGKYAATEDFRTTVFRSGTEGYHTFRIPTLVKAANGDLLAIAEGRKNAASDAGNIDLVMKRSTDGGRTWSAVQLIQDEDADPLGKITIGNPTPVVDRMDPAHAGRIWLPFTRNNDRVFVTYSDDHGATWAKRVEITAAVKDPTWGWYATGPVHGIQLERGPHVGRLIIPADHRVGSDRWGSHVVYSDDHGRTWRLGAADTHASTDPVHPNENTAVELVDGRLYLNARNQKGSSPATRAVAHSRDGGLTYDAPFAPEPNLLSPVVQNSALRFAAADRGDAENILLYVSPKHQAQRRDLTLRMSFDEGKTWTNDVLIHSGPAAYSDLVKLDSRHVGVLYEAGAALYGEIVFSSQAITAVSEPAIRHAVIEPAAPDMPRADTASVVELADGRLLVAYQKYGAGEVRRDDLGRCQIWSKTSADGGLTWDKGRMLVDIAPGDLNVAVPAILRLTSGDVLLVCLRVHSAASSTECLFRSRDGGQTFVEEPPVWKRSKGMWLQGGGGSLVQLQSGRVLLPLHGGTGDKGRQKNSVWCFLSDDQGKTWRRSRGQIDLPKRGAMEPSVAQLADGALVMSLRTQLGGPYIARSTDEGETWSEARPSGLESGESCTCLRRIPDTNDLVLFWNNSKYVAKGHHHYGERTPLTAAVSRDAGKTWRVVGNLADDPQAEYTNLGCTFTSRGQAVVTYMAARPAWNRNQISLEAAVFDAEWLRKGEKRP
jgi:hypothetical protein